MNSLGCEIIRTVLVKLMKVMNNILSLIENPTSSRLDMYLVHVHDPEICHLDMCQLVVVKSLLETVSFYRENFYVMTENRLLL